MFWLNESCVAAIEKFLEVTTIRKTKENAWLQIKQAKFETDWELQMFSHITERCWHFRVNFIFFQAYGAGRA